MPEDSPQRFAEQVRITSSDRVATGALLSLLGAAVARIAAHAPSR